MNIVKKFPKNTLVDVASKIVDENDKNLPKGPAITIGSINIQEVKEGWNVKSTSGTYSKITGIIKSEDSVKKVNLSSGNSFLVDANSDIVEGEELTEFDGLLTSTVISIEDAGTAPLFELVTEGDGSLVINNIALT